MQTDSNSFKRYFRWSVLSILSGTLAGLAATVFLWLLQWATNTREANPILIWFLPLAGFFMGWVYHHYGKDVAAGSNLVIEEIHDPKKVIPASMTPLVMFASVISHLFGGSVGREGAAVQMGASLSDQLSRFFKVENEERKILLTTGTGAGFGAAMGTPWAGVIFGMEVVRVGKLKPFAVVESLLASFTGYYVTELLHAPHSQFPVSLASVFDFKSFLWIFVAGVFFGLAGFAFVQFTHLVEMIQHKIKYTPLKPFLAGLLIVLLYYVIGNYRYAGLGIPIIREALSQTVSFLDPVYKIIFTGLSVGSGFKGGEFVPMLFIGATLGSALSSIIPVATSTLAACGLVAVIAGASNTPLACSIMAIELFGWTIAPYAVVACYVAYLCSGSQGIYKSQRFEARKHERFYNSLLLLGELPSRFVNRK